MVLARRKFKWNLQHTYESNVELISREVYCFPMNMGSLRVTELNLEDAGCTPE